MRDAVSSDTGLVAPSANLLRPGVVVLSCHVSTSVTFAAASHNATQNAPQMPLDVIDRVRTKLDDFRRF